MPPPSTSEEERLDGEALDLHYRCQFVASNEGELSFSLPRDDAWHPPSIADGTTSEQKEEQEVIPQVILNAKDMRVSLRKPYKGIKE